MCGSVFTRIARLLGDIENEEWPDRQKRLAFRFGAAPWSSYDDDRQ